MPLTSHFLVVMSFPATEVTSCLTVCDPTAQEVTPGTGSGLPQPHAPLPASVLGADLTSCPTSCL
jgi:hypothetical protein